MNEGSVLCRCTTLIDGISSAFVFLFVSYENVCCERTLINDYPPVLRVLSSSVLTLLSRALNSAWPLWCIAVLSVSLLMSSGRPWSLVGACHSPPSLFLHSSGPVYPCRHSSLQLHPRASLVKNNGRRGESINRRKYVAVNDEMEDTTTNKKDTKLCYFWVNFYYMLHN